MKGPLQRAPTIERVLEMAPPYARQWQGEEWIQVCYDTGACTTAVPGLLAQDVELSKVGELIVANEAPIPNYGKSASKS